jgi:predicted DsbA family dithiol-disulfide isomerase
MAVESALVTATTVEANEFPDLIDRYGLTGVPMTIVDERVQVLGALAEDVFVPQVLQEQPGS